MLLDRNQLIKEFGPNLVEKTSLYLNRSSLINNPYFKSFHDTILKTIDIGKINQSFNTRFLSKLNEQITKIDQNAFRGLSNLEFISLDNNQIKKLDANIFEGLDRLKTLYLENSQIFEIDTRAFQGLSGLVKLGLERNKLTNLDSNLFNPLVSLEILFLHENLITHINSKCFSGLKKIRFLSLCRNKTSFISFSIQDSSFASDLICSYKFVTDFDEFMLQFNTVNSENNNIEGKVYNSRFKVTRIIGEGSFGQVFQVHDLIEKNE